jgi:hypothetical protein
MGINGWDYGVRLDLHCMYNSWVGAEAWVIGCHPSMTQS